VGVKGCAVARGFRGELKGFEAERRVNIIEPDRKIRC